MHGSIALVCMPLRGHLKRVLPLIEGLVAHGRTVHVFTHEEFRREVEEVGGLFTDLFARYPLDAVDGTSFPLPSRFVTYAAAYAESLSRDIEALGAGLIIHDSFAVIGSVVARLTGLPRVNVCSGHNRNPAAVEDLGLDAPRIDLSSGCLVAVEKLRRMGVPDASPFLYLTGLSPDLNIYCEPPEFLPSPDRHKFEPVAFFGSLRPRPAERPGSARVYISFGTVIWRYFKPSALAALQVLVDGFPDREVLVSLGGWELSRVERESLARPNVRVEDYVDQWSVLAGAELLVTHQGLNTTHEAVYHRVPMISYPFFSDQPRLAGRCRELGLGIPLVGKLRAPIGPQDIAVALRHLARHADDMAARLSRARRWELDVIADRRRVIERILDLERDPATARVRS